MVQRLTLLLTVILLMTGCGASSAVPITDGFTAQVALEYEEQLYEGTFTCQSPDVAQLVLSTPDTVNGLTFSLEEGTLTLSYAGVSLAVEESSMPVCAAMKLLCGTLEQSHSDQPLDSTTVSGEWNGVSYEIVFEEEAGYPSFLSVPSIPLQVTFSDWEVA